MTDIRIFRVVKNFQHSGVRYYKGETIIYNVDTIIVIPVMSVGYEEADTIGLSCDLMDTLFSETIVVIEEININRD